MPSEKQVRKMLQNAADSLPEHSFRVGDRVTEVLSEAGLRDMNRTGNMGNVVEISKYNRSIGRRGIMVKWDEIERPMWHAVAELIPVKTEK